MKGLDFIVVGILAMALSGCSLVSNLKSTPATGSVGLPTSAQLLATCAAEKAAGKSGVKALDCDAYTVLDNACKTVSMAPALAPIEAGAEIAVPALAVPGSLLNETANVSIALCTTQGFYGPQAQVTVAPVATK